MIVDESEARINYPLVEIESELEIKHENIAKNNFKNASQKTFSFTKIHMFCYPSRVANQIAAFASSRVE